MARKPQPSPRMVETDTCSRQNRRPDDVAQGFQVIADAINPIPRSGNLFTKDVSRPVCGQERRPDGPEVATVPRAPPASACRARERLTRTTARPNRSVVGPSRQSEGVAPSADASEEVALGVASEIIGLDILDISLVHVAWGNVPRRDQVAEPLRGVRLVLVVVGAHAARPFFSPSASAQPFRRPNSRWRAREYVSALSRPRW